MTTSSLFDANFGYGKSSKKPTFLDLCSQLLVFQEDFGFFDSPREGALVHPKWTSTCAGGCRRGGGARREFLDQGAGCGSLSCVLMVPCSPSVKFLDPNQEHGVCTWGVFC